MIGPSFWAAASPAQLAIFQEVFDERARQDEKWGVQDYPVLDPARARRDHYPVIPTLRALRARAQRNCDRAAKAGQLDWTLIALEELWEVAESAAHGEDDQTRAELVQLAAVAVAAIDSIDRRAGR